MTGRQTPTAPPVVTIPLSGVQTVEGGAKITFTEKDLRETAACYDGRLDAAPLVVGKPALRDPAYGWVKSLQAVGGNLVATTDHVCPSFAELVRGNRYERIAASFYGPINPNNPKPGNWYLRHVGFLGGPTPTDYPSGVVAFAAPDDAAITVTLDAPQPLPGFSAPPGYKILGDDLALMDRALALQAASPDLPFMAAIHQARQEVSFAEPSGSAAARQEATVARARQIRVYFPHLSLAEALERAANELVFAKYIQ